MKTRKHPNPVSFFSPFSNQKLRKMKTKFWIKMQLPKTKRVIEGK
jgi:hypothetical protein